MKRFRIPLSVVDILQSKDLAVEMTERTEPSEAASAKLLSLYDNGSQVFRDGIDAACISFTGLSFPEIVAAAYLHGVKGTAPTVEEAKSEVADWQMYV